MAVENVRHECGCRSKVHNCGDLHAVRNWSPIGNPSINDNAGGSPQQVRLNGTGI
jgi:hypothetical protein